ncbi:midasin [Iris pallida]|uniref:Midasin n=1 Tax=Iris pallida TaxID=29817 RepID=A0AAX6IBB4_IRIPA|nr:midasin [Iris pallida]
MKNLHVSLDLLLTFGEGIISEFLDAHKTMAEMTHVLAQLFVLLFSKGFGAAEESTEDTTCDGSQNVNGTGMGEGEGMNDVSDQIDDESQLLGTSEKQEDELGNSDKVQSNEDKGIEMEEDFTAETCSVSEDSGDDENEDEEEINLDSQMGQSEDGNQIVDEKLWNKEEDDKPENSVEKYESGPSVKETGVSDKEIRAREDDALPPDESGELGNDEPDKKLCNEENSNNISDDEGKSDDMNLDKNKAFEEPSGVQLSEQEQNLDDINTDDMDMDENQEMQETDSDPDEADEHVKDEDEQSIPTDHMGDEKSNQMDDDPEAKEEDADNVNMDLESSQATFESNKIESSLHPPLDHQPAEPVRDSHEAASSIETEMHWTSNGNMVTGLAPSRSSPFDEIPKTESAMPDTSDGAKLTSDQPKTHTSEDDIPSATKTPSNPYRSIGDAMKEWKERVKVAVDPQEQIDGPEDHDDDENADEYKYVSEFEKSTSQALGSATSDQTRDNIERKSPNEDDADVRKKEDVDRMDPVNEHPDTCNLTTGHSSLSKQKLDEEMQDTVVSNDELMEEQQQDNQNGSSSDMVSFERSYMKERMMPVDDIFKRSLDMKPMDLDLSEDVKQKAMADWKRYELATGKVSQQLAEQLRLVMEPTLASKLQGDYRTGKRINMKKVIPYIASHYRKDKIWLRRTRPNKRDYQVVVAVDDSRSMSESHCGSAALESLVTVCRAMSQLEVGQFAVASFGEKGNIRLLHDFDQPFTGDAGVKIISSLSFKQDNTIADEPVVDLLKYLNNMLDTAVVKARTPSGQNPLHQLILIIADGRFHEKEKLKRCVRNVLNRKRMVAFIVLDSPNESIMNVEEASFEGGKVSITKYLNSFPFPYYIILRNMETLPLALADLLRQWFELMQSTSD